jgi:hypothetical protein
LQEGDAKGGERKRCCPINGNEVKQYKSMTWIKIMKIAISAEGKELNDRMDTRFGRARDS